MTKSVPRSSRQLDYMKTIWPSWGDANWSGMDMSPVHQIWPKPPSKAQFKGDKDKGDRKGGGKTSGNGQAWSLLSSRGQRRTEKNGMNFLVGNMVFVWDAQYLAVAPHFHGLYSSLELSCEGPWFTSIQKAYSATPNNCTYCNRCKCHLHLE